MSETTIKETGAAAETSDGSTEATESTEVTATETTEAPTTEVRDPEKLLKAYEAEKAKRKEQDSALRELRAEFDAIKAKSEGKEAEYAAQQEAQRVRDEALEVANTRIVGAELRAAAKGKVTDEALADLSLYIKPSDFEVGPDGEVDDSAIADAITDLIARKPYLAAQGKRFQGTADGGARNGSTQPSQLTKADMAGMTPEQIDAAHNEGRFTDLLGSR